MTVSVSSTDIDLRYPESVSALESVVHAGNVLVFGPRENRSGIVALIRAPSFRLPPFSIHVALLRTGVFAVRGLGDLEMRVVVVGMGGQGAKRWRAAGPDAVAKVDPVKDGVDYQRVEDVPLDIYDAALLCVPDDPKAEAIGYLLEAGKHVLVEVTCASRGRHVPIRVLVSRDKYMPSGVNTFQQR